MSSRLIGTFGANRLFAISRAVHRAGRTETVERSCWLIWIKASGSGRAYNFRAGTAKLGCARVFTMLHARRERDTCRERYSGLLSQVSLLLPYQALFNLRRSRRFLRESRPTSPRI
jgi:hypothetical protein